MLNSIVYLGKEKIIEEKQMKSRKKQSLETR